MQMWAHQSTALTIPSNSRGAGGLVLWHARGHRGKRRGRCHATHDQRQIHLPCRLAGSGGGRACSLLSTPCPKSFPQYHIQSFWPDGIYTAPTDAALAFDVEAVKTFGLNMIRLHQKVGHAAIADHGLANASLFSFNHATPPSQKTNISQVNPERWYWVADKLGIVVMQDMPQVGMGTGSAAPSKTIFPNPSLPSPLRHKALWRCRVYAECRAVLPGPCCHD